MSRTARSPLWAVVPGLVALAAAAARWLVQGAGNVYTDLGRRLYLPDPDLGWRVSADTPVFLGLDALALLGGTALALAAAGWWIARRERAGGVVRRRLRLGLWLVSCALLAVPAVAFASGLGPAGASIRLPRGLAVAAPTAVARDAALDLPAGRFEVARHPGSRVVISIAAGGERFDAGFATPTGWWQGDPRDLTQPQTAHVEVAAGEIDTGVRLRSAHAARLLDAPRYPAVTLDLLAIDGARRDPAGVAFAARGRLTVMGRPLDVPLRGTLRAADAEAQRRLGIGPALLLAADSALDLRETALAPRARDFDDPRVDIHVDLVLVRATH